MTDTADNLREQTRLWALQSFRVLDAPRQSEFDDLVRLASKICDTSIALVSLVDHDRLWFMARIGVEDIEQIPRNIDAFCCHAISEPRTFMEVADARGDARFSGNALVTGDLGIRFYAAMPLTTAQGEAIGTFCVLDREPRRLDDSQRQALRALARLTMGLLEARRRELEAQRALLDRDYRLHVRQRAQTGKTASNGCAVALVRIDNFKGIENCFADEAGTRALEMVAQVIDRCAPCDVIASRYGSNEFLAILSDIAHAQAAAALEQVRAQVEALTLPFPLSVSIGAATGSEPIDSIDQLYQQADHALVQARAGGGNRALLAGEYLAVA